MAYNLEKPSRLRDSFQFVWKVVIIGDAWTGKTTYLNCIMDDTFTSETKITIGSNFYTQYLRVFLESKENPQNMDAVCVIWDFAGEHRFRPILESYFNGANALMIFYDVSSLATLENIADWFDWSLKRKNAPDFKDSIVIVGNKSDLGINQQVKEKLDEIIAKIPGAKHYYISCKTRENIYLPLEGLVKKLLLKSKDEIRQNLNVRMNATNIRIERIKRGE